ncbi:hypothetical protein SAMN05660464_0753 [Geodermatophilus dictyosporus]|uniref:Uncharacterized protein n=1 Tax=Geodermatophilus dictyosporus TaxID=1523247 RepID=A0A1I5JHA0_9ACTN|nr:DUF6221 family protein [Geodermatophilus dictyosporus]SFO72198.1 hypothetical protein SAMN05660464_0753 [Geodermatophilus dictyosporus]
MDTEAAFVPEALVGPGAGPELDEFVMARIAEDKRVAARAAETPADGDLPGPLPPEVAEHAARFGPGRVLADCAAMSRLVQACRDVRPDTRFLGSRPSGLPDFPPTPTDHHQLAALALALLALPHARHPDYREEWRP